jgi:DNA-binding transcriptional regulator YiaG
MKPDARKLDTSPEYVQALIGSTGMTQDQLGEAIGVTGRTVRNWLSGRQTWPYAAQFAIECIVLLP